MIIQYDLVVEGSELLEGSLEGSLEEPLSLEVSLAEDSWFEALFGKSFPLTLKILFFPASLVENKIWQKMITLYVNILYSPIINVTAS